MPVLRGVDLQIGAREFVCLMGSSGSGKTTLLNLVGGLDAADAGTIRVCGEDLAAMQDAARSRFRLKHIGFVFQFFNLLPNLTVRENIMLPLLFLNMPEGVARKEADEMAERVGLSDKLPRPVHQLSGGEMQRTGLARGLVHKPSILLADEPTGNLDSKTGDTILQLIHDATRQLGVTVLMATHDPKAAAISDRVIHMQDGRISS